MRDSAVIAISLCSFLIGLAMLAYLSERTMPAEAEISSLSRIEPGKDVLMLAEVSSVRRIGSIVLVRVSQKKEIDVVLEAAEEGVENQIMPGDIVEIEGEAAEYKGKSEISARKMRVVR